jgi:hypothetical protein
MQYLLPLLFIVLSEKAGRLGNSGSPSGENDVGKGSVSGDKRAVL